MITATTTIGHHWAAGSFRAITGATTPLKLLQAAYLAQGAIERIHDLTSLDTATMALLHFERLLIRADYGTQGAARDLGLRENGEPAPTLMALTTAHLEAWKRLYFEIHASGLAPAI